MTLWEIDQALLACIDAETGEIDEEMWNALSIERDVKIEHTAILIKELLLQASGIHEEEKRLAERRKQKERTAERLKTNLDHSLFGQKFETSRVSVTYRKSEAVEIAPDARIPLDFLRYKDPEPDKTRLKAAIKDGMEFEGIKIVEKRNICIK